LEEDRSFVTGFEPFVVDLFDLPFGVVAVDVAVDAHEFFDLLDAFLVVLFLEEVLGRWRWGWWIRGR
jgi:hypothetical protein